MLKRLSGVSASLVITVYGNSSGVPGVFRCSRCYRSKPRCPGVSVMSKENTIYNFIIKITLFLLLKLEYHNDDKLVSLDCNFNKDDEFLSSLSVIICQYLNDKI